MSSTLILKAQDKTRVKVLGKNLVTVVEGRGKGNEVKIWNNSIDIIDGHDDSVKVRVGRKALVISDGKHGSNIELNTLNDQEMETYRSQTQV